MGDVLERIAALPAEKRAVLLRQLQERKQPAADDPNSYDVVIVGGGMAGLTLALQIKKTRPSTRILVVEKQQHPVPESAHKVGESTVEIAAHYLRDVLGLQEHLKTQQLRKFGLRMFFSANGNQDITQRVELGSTVFPPLVTYQLDRGRLENALGSEVQRYGIVFLDSCKVKEISLQQEQNSHRLQLLHEGKELTIQARWVVDASGRSAVLKRQLGLAKKVAHSANAVWLRVNHPIDIKLWSNDPEWHARVSNGDRSLSTCHLVGPGYWVWLIRLASGSTSVGIVTDANMHSFEDMNLFERALAWLHVHEPQCAAIIEQHQADVQDFRVLKNYAYSAEQVYSSERWCLTGEAAISIDPLYSPGSDFIAISNGLICDLINRDLNGKNIRDRAVIHNKLLLTLTDVWLKVYEQQYSLLGNAQVMVAKIIWDTAVYWGVFGLLYFHDKFPSLADKPEMTGNLFRFSRLNNRVQAFFREWNALDQPALSDTFVDLYSPLDFMVQLHTGMATDLTDAELEARFVTNIHLFEQLAGQIVSKVIATYADQRKSEAMQSQIQQWQTESFLADLMAFYRHEDETNPLNDSWIAVAYQHQYEQEAVR